MSSPTPGWNPDPSGRHEYRYWDGSNWTDDVADGGVTSTDPLAGAGGGYPSDAAPTSTGEPTQAYGPDPGAPATPDQGGYQQAGYDQPGYQQPGDPTAGYSGAGAAGPGAGAPGGYDPYGTGAPYGSGAPYGAGDQYGASGGFPPATPPKKSTPVGLLIGLAVAAVVIIVVVAVVLLGGSDDDDDPTTGSTTTSTEADETTTTDEPEETTTTVAGPETQGVFTLAVGDCVTDSSLEGEVSEVSIIDCSQPHTSEVFHSYEMTDAALPDQAGIETIVRDQCLPAFESFVGLPSSSSTLAVSYLSPTPESWDNGDRELLCLVADPAGETTGSLAGANR